MLVSTAHAQAAGGGSDMMLQLMPLLLIFVVFYFLLIRPQQKKAKEHRAMVAAVQRGDSVLTAGGIFGKVTKGIEVCDALEKYGSSSGATKAKCFISDCGQL